jgi:nucleotide-binding universal stress UspA family protein
MDGPVGAKWSPAPMAAQRESAEARSDDGDSCQREPPPVSDEVTTPSPGLRRPAVPVGTAERPPQGGGLSGRHLNGTIVCVVDDPAEADTAIEVARRLADQFRALVLLVSVSDRVGAFGTRERDETDEEQRVVAGDPAEEVARIAAEEAADMIVVGARRGLRAETLRSLLAADLAATASCPVVVAPPRSRSTNAALLHRAPGAG